MAAALNPTDPVNLENLSEEEMLEYVKKLSLDPTQQENPEHQAFMRLTSQDPEPIAISHPRDQHDTSKDFEYALRLQEEEKASQASARSDIDTSNDELIARQLKKEFEDDLVLRKNRNKLMKKPKTI